jgi:hypothetical protein
MTDESRTIGRNVLVGFLALLTCVFLASYFGARLGATMSNAELLDALQRSLWLRRKQSRVATGDGKRST